MAVLVVTGWLLLSEEHHLRDTLSKSPSPWPHLQNGDSDLTGLWAR